MKSIFWLFVLYFILYIYYKIFKWFFTFPDHPDERPHFTFRDRKIALDRENQRLDAEYEKKHENTFVDTDILDSHGKPVKRKWDKNRDKRQRLKW